MKGEWFQWERQATVHPILMCMEAWMEPMKKEYGRPWPTTVIIYNGDLVGWYNKWAELLEYGQYLIDIFIRKERMAGLEREVTAQANELEQLFRELDDADLRAITDGELGAVYERIHQSWVKWFVPGGLVEPIGHQGEKILEKRLHGKEGASKIISLITTTTRESFSRREMKGMLGILAAKKAGEDVGPKLREHAARYFWLHNNYFATGVLDYQFFFNELKVLEDRYPDPTEQLAGMKKDQEGARDEKERIIGELGFDTNERALVELLDLFAWYQDYRKEYIMRMLHYLDLVLGEIGARKGISQKEMKYCLPSEIPAILAGGFDRKLLQERMQRCLFYWNADAGKAEFGAGSFSIEKEREIFHSLKHDEDIVEVSGMVASRGIVRGRARITMSAKDAASIQKGEILITSMTTPDFVTAIKRAAAIVTNEGGVLCHAAVISREFGIPCIVGSRIATRVFKTGDLVEVDGNLGIARKIRE
jgi:phosphohistidine swiveling domain-containing protein